MKTRKFFSTLILASLLPLFASATIVNGERQKPTFPTQGFVTNQEVYMLNVGSGKFFTQGNAWATQASVGSEPRLVKFQPNSAYDYTMLCYCWRSSNDQGGYMDEAWRNVFFDSETQLFVDRNGQANYFFAVEQNGETFRISTSQNNPTFSDYYGAELYVGLMKNSSSTALLPFVEENEAYVDWAIVTKEDYDGLADDLAIYEKAQELKAWIDRIESVNGNASSLNSVYLNEDATMEELQAVIDGALTVYAQALIDNAENHDNVDVTVLLKNPDFEQSKIHERDTYGWITEAAPGGGNVRTGGTDANKCYEAWGNDGFDVYQEVAAAPLGVYEIEVHGFYRYSGDNTALEAYYASLENGKPIEVPVYVYMNNHATPLKNYFDEQVPQGELYTDDTSLLDSAVPLPPIVDKFGYWYPNDMNNCATAFNSGLYAQSAYGLVARNGDVLRIGVKGVSNQGGGSWPIWDNFRLIYRGFKPEVVLPVLEQAISDCDNLKNCLMGKTEYAALSKAFADAAKAIERNDGEAMFQALNALYDAKDPARESKDIFLEQKVPADTVRLAEAIADVADKKLSKATLQEAQALLAAIKGNTKYEGTEIDQLKSDVTAAIEAINNSVAIYASLNKAIVAVKESVAKKAYQTLVDEANELLTPAEAGYEDGSLTDVQAKAQTEALWSKQNELTASIEAYANLAAAIDRLKAAIEEVGETATKSTLKKANLRLTASQKLYDEGTIDDADIDARVKSIDELIESLTASVRLRQQYDEAIGKLNNAVENAQGKVNNAMMQNAQTLQTTIKADYEQGNVDDENVPAEIAKIENIIAALQAAPTAYEHASEKLGEIATAEQTLDDFLVNIANIEAKANAASLVSPYLEQAANDIAAGRQGIEQLRKELADLKTKVENLIVALNAIDLTIGSEPVNSIIKELEAITVDDIISSGLDIGRTTEEKVQQSIDDSIATGISTLRYVADGNEWYNLNGRKLAGKPLRQGVYICNGKRVVVK